MRNVLITCLVIAAFSGVANAANPVALLSVATDRPTVTTLGVQVLISDDDNLNATATVRYRVQGDASWRSGPALHRVRPDLVVGRTVPAQFAGSIFDLAPGTAYELEIHLVDPDGPVDVTQSVTSRTRAVPADPATPRVVNVSDAASLTTALGTAQPGDVITLGAGTYAGTFSITSSASTSNPIVIRGVDRDSVILDGQGCTGCNILEVYGSNVHLERLTLRNAERAVRFQSASATGNVMRRVRITDVTLGIGGKPDQTDFYICDNVVEGRLAWPLTYGDDGAAHASDDGIVVNGSGHVVCHNQIQGFADALQSFQPGARANDFYGNEILFTYDDGIELDGSEGNVRAFRNRFTNTYDTLSFQPIYGGPAYAFRNVIDNVANEGFKLHALGGSTPQPPVGVLLEHNTFLRAGHAIQLSTPNPVHDYVVEDNLFLGSPTDGQTVAWDTPIDASTGLIDWNGYAPDGTFELGYGPTGHTYSSFADLVSGGAYEAHGVLLSGTPFASGVAAPTDRNVQLAPPDVALASGSSAVDRATPIPGIDDAFIGAGPDLGAEELGCPQPIYGVRPEGIDERTEIVGCTQATSGSSGSSGATSSSTSTSGTSGGSTASTGTSSTSGVSGGSTGGAASASGSTGGGGSPKVSGCGCSANGEGSALGFVVACAAWMWRRQNRQEPAARS